MGCEYAFCHCSEAPYETGGYRFCGLWCATMAGNLPEPPEEGCACGHAECTSTDVE